MLFVKLPTFPSKSNSGPTVPYPGPFPGDIHFPFSVSSPSLFPAVIFPD